MSKDRKIKPGEKEIVLASEEVTRRNVMAVVEHSNETRKLIRALEEKIKILENAVSAQDRLLKIFRNNLANLQQQFYAAGTTSYYGDNNRLADKSD